MVIWRSEDIHQHVKGTAPNVLLAIAGIYASHSTWMEWEMDTAIRNGIPVIGVIPHGASRVSQIVANRSVEQVRWSTESIVDAIRRHAR